MVLKETNMEICDKKKIIAFQEILSLSGDDCWIKINVKKSEDINKVYCSFYDLEERQQITLSQALSRFLKYGLAEGAIKILPEVYLRDYCLLLYQQLHLTPFIIE